MCGGCRGRDDLPGARQLRVPRGAQPGLTPPHHQLLLALTLLQALVHGRVLRGEVRVQGRGVSRVLQAQAGQLLFIKPTGCRLPPLRLAKVGGNLLGHVNCLYKRKC